MKAFFWFTMGVAVLIGCEYAGQEMSIRCLAAGGKLNTHLFWIDTCKVTK